MKGLRDLRVRTASSLSLTLITQADSSHSSAITASAVQLLLTTTAAIIHSKNTDDAHKQERDKDRDEVAWMWDLEY